MGRLAARFSTNGIADKPAVSARCQMRHHKGCSGCKCQCHHDPDWRPNVANRARDRSTKVRHHGMGAEADLEQELDLAKISALHLQGVSKPQIAVRLGCSLEHVENSIRILRRRWANSSIRDIDAAIQEEIAKIDNLESEHWQAWERSKAVELPIAERQRLLRQYGIRITTVGDATFLQGVLACIDRRIKLLGLDAPIKVDITTKIRLMAEAAGLDPDEAVEEAKRVIAEARAGLAQPVDDDG